MNILLCAAFLAGMFALQAADKVTATQFYTLTAIGSVGILGAGLKGTLSKLFGAVLKAFKESN